MNLLFICSRNQWRSRTAEDLFKNNGRHEVRSAGTADGARIRVSEKLVQWADVIVVMENKHRQLLQQRFPHAIHQKEIVVLHIPDEYAYMDEELVVMLQAACAEWMRR